MNNIDEIRELWKRRQSWHRAEKSLVLQAKAMCRRIVGGDKTEADKLYQAAVKGKPHPMQEIALAVIAPLKMAEENIYASRREAEKRLEKLAKELPEAQWVGDTRGFGYLGLSAVIAEAGDLTNYANPCKLWKRMGLAVMQDGKRQRRIAGVDAIEQGYSPSRRSLIWTLGDSLLKAQSGNDNRDAGPYRELYDQRKEYEISREGITKMHAHLRAKRYVEKRLLRDLWRVSRDIRGIV